MKRREGQVKKLVEFFRVRAVNKFLSISIPPKGEIEEVLAVVGVSSEFDVRITGVVIIKKGIRAR